MPADPSDLPHSDACMANWRSVKAATGFSPFCVCRDELGRSRTETDEQAVIAHFQAVRNARRESTDVH